MPDTPIDDLPPVQDCTSDQLQSMRNQVLTDMAAETDPRRKMTLRNTAENLRHLIEQKA